MTSVVDASVLVAALVDTGSDGVWAEAALAERSLVGPDLLPAEVSNVLRRLEHAGRISTLEAASAHRDLLRIDVDLFPFAACADRIWALRNSLTSYDAWYVALAELFDCPLVTLDRRIGRAAGLKCDVVLPPRPRM